MYTFHPAVSNTVCVFSKYDTGQTIGISAEWGRFVVFDQDVLQAVTFLPDMEGIVIAATK